MHHDEDRGLRTRRARHCRDIGDIRDEGDHEDDRGDDREDARRVVGEAPQGGVEQHRNNRRDHGHDDCPADVGEREKLRVIADQRATDEVEQRIRDHRCDGGAETDKGEARAVDGRRLCRREEGHGTGGHLTISFHRLVSSFGSTKTSNEEK
jgi:hypothetical protein